MKTIYTIYKQRLGLKAFALLPMFLLSASLSFGQLSGNYTINKDSAASTTNFQSFAAFKTALASGVSGPIVVEVGAGSGPYSENVLFTAVSGASATNTITIDGNGEKIQSSSTYVIGLNGADWFTFDDLKVENTLSTNSTTSYNKCFWMYSSADNNTIVNCELTMPNFSSSDNASCYIGIMNSQSSPTSYGDPGQNILIKNNKMSSSIRKGPYAGITIVNESSGQTLHRVTVEDNDISQFYYYGIYGNYCSETVIVGNKIHNTGTNYHTRGASTMYGVYLYPYRKSVGESKVNGNEVVNLRNYTSTAAQYGIYVNNYYSYGKSFEVNDNVVDMKGRGTMYGIYHRPYYAYITDKLETSGNDVTVFNDNTSTTGYYTMYGIYFYPYYTRNVDVIKANRNEIDLHNKSYAYALWVYPYYASGLTQPLEIQNNLISCRSDYYQYGIYCYPRYVTAGVNVYNNTVNLGKSDNGSFNYAYNGRCYAMYLYYMDKGKVKNNIVNIHNRRDGYSYIYYNQYSTNMEYENNSLWIDPSVGGSTYYGYTGSNHTTFNDWVGFAKPINTVNENPDYTTPYESRPTTMNMELINAGIPISTVTVDKDGIVRNTQTPDIGAIEFYFDVEPVSINLVGTAECAGYEETFTATLRNNNAFDVPYLFGQLYSNGELVGESKSTSGTVAAGQTADVEFTVTFYGEGTQTLELFGYRSDNTASVTKTIDISAAPSGGSFVANSGSKGMHLNGDFDVTIVPDGIVFDMLNPKSFTNNDYGTGTGWGAKAVTTYADGTPVASGDAAVWTAPSGGNPGYVTLSNTSNAIIDSVINVCVNVYNEITNCDTTICRKVLIAPEGKPDFINPLVNCDGDEVAFDNASTVSTGTLTYEWDFGDGQTSVLTHPIHKYASSGTYNVKLTTTTHPWEYKNEITKQIVIKDVPNASFTRLNACEGTAIQLTNTSTGGTDYTWNFGDPSQADVYTKDASVTYAPGGYTVTLTVGGNGCEATVSKPVYQFAMPTAGFSNTSGACNTDDFVFVNSSTIADGSVGFSWDFDDNGNISTDANPVYNFENAGDHEVSLTAVSEFGCEHTTKQTISVKAGPDVSFTYDGTCSESATNFTNGTTFPGVWNATYRWDFGDGSAVDGNVNPSHNWSETGDLQVTLTVDLDNSCSGSYTETVKVLPQPVAAFDVNASCVGDEVVFENNSTWKEGDISFTWDFDGSVIAATDAVSPKGNAVASGSYDVTLTAKVSEGCSNSITKTLVVSETPTTCQIVATPDHVNGVNGYKFESSKDGSTAATEADVTYYWIVEDHGTQTGSSVNVDFQEEGDFTVQLTARNNTTGCECTSSMNHNNVGIEDELTLENNLILYPNPAKSEVTIAIEQESAKQATIEIVNSVGAVVMTIDSKELVDGKIIVDVNDLSSGLYLVRITSGHTISTKKLNIIE